MHRAHSILRPVSFWLLAACAACSADEETTAQSVAASPRPAIEAISVSVAPVVRQAMSSSYATSATLRAEKRSTVTSRTRGVLEELLVEEGEEVATGQVIARLENDEQELAVKRFREVEELKSRELGRQTELNEQNIVSDNDVEVVRREMREAKNDLAVAELNLERTVIKAPFDGLVLVRYLDVGATVADGTQIYDVADVDPLYVDVRVPERHVARLTAGQEVRIRADELEAMVAAKIERLAPLVDPTTGTVKVTVAVERNVALRPGAFVEVEVVTDVHDEALVAPRSALVAEGRRWTVFRVQDGDELVEAIEVTLGYESGDLVEIAGSVGARTLAAGDRIVVLGASALSEGASIRVLEERGGPSTDSAGDAEPDEVGDDQKVSAAPTAE